MGAHASQAAIARAEHPLTTLPELVVLALGHPDPEDDATPAAPLGEDADVLAWLQRLALPDSEGVNASVFVGLPKSRWERPRGHGWADFPLVSDMRARFDLGKWSRARVHHGPCDRVRPAHALAPAIALRSARAYALLLTGEAFSSLDEAVERAAIAACTRFLDHVGADGDRTVVVARIGRPPAVTTVRDLGALCPDALARDRLIYSYAVSASVIHGRILADLIDGAPPPEVPGGCYRFGDDWYADDDLAIYGLDAGHARQGFLSALGQPLGLQALYRLRALGPGGCPSEGGRLWQFPDMAVIGGAEAGPGAPLWAGTGRYEPAPFDTHTVLVALIMATRYGLVGPSLAADGTRRGVALTGLGHAFLDALHPDCEDPDCVLRWSAPRPADQAAMDSWVLRGFRKAKHRSRRADPPQA